MATDRWDALLSDSNWYVPAANLLAYKLDSDSPDDPIPASDQTLWAIGEADNGRFSGQSLVRIVDATGAETTSLAAMDGVVTPRGQARISFTTPLGSTITGIGQLRRVNGGPAVEMQMITGAAGTFTTHWAYMLRLKAGSTPPDPAAIDGQQRAYRSGSHRWLLGTRWALRPRDAALGGRGPRGRFTISGYHNGYFWGQGAGRVARGDFSVLGSVTPEGNFFFNAIRKEGFKLRVSQGGWLRGDRHRAAARLRPYAAETGQLERPLELRLLADPLIGGGAGGSQARAGEGPQRRLAADPGRRDQPLSPAPVGWPDPFPRPDQGLLATDRAMASLAGGADAGGLG
jgi:hypothetical protein